MIADVVEQVSSKWWTFLLRGLVALALGAFAFMKPGTMGSALAYVVAAYFIISGVIALYDGLTLRGVGRWWLLIIYGIASIAFGVVMFTQPSTGPLALAYLVALWAVTTGVLEIVSAIELRNYIKNEFWWALLGVVTVALGVYIIYRPDLGVLALVYAIGVYGIVAGLTLIIFSFRLKAVGDDVGGATTPTQ